MKTRRLICSPMYGTAHGLKPIEIEGWENVTLFNYGEQAKPILKQGTDLTTKGTRLHDWEYGKPREVRREWATLLRATKPGDIALGVNTFVNDDRWDDSVGQTANILKGTGVSLATEFYIGNEADWNWNHRWDYRRNRLQTVAYSTNTPSTQCLQVVCGREYGKPDVHTDTVLRRMADRIMDGFNILLFAPAATPAARAVVEEATRKLAAMIGPAEMAGGVE